MILTIGGSVALCPHCECNDLVDDTTMVPAHFKCNGCGATISYTEILQHLVRQSKRRTATVLSFGLSRQHAFHATVHLAIGNGSLVDRLRAAHEMALRHIVPNPGIPVRLRPTFEELMTKLDQLLRNGETDMAQAKKLAKDVVMLHTELCKESP